MARIRILVIDDEEIVRISCLKCLQLEGYDVTTAETGMDGLRLSRSEHYDLIITDLKMPYIDGIEVLLTLKKTQPGAKVMIMTGYSSVEHAEEAVRLGACGYIEKPFTPDALITAVKKALE